MDVGKKDDGVEEEVTPKRLSVRDRLKQFECDSDTMEDQPKPDVNSASSTLVVSNIERDIAEEAAIKQRAALKLEVPSELSLVDNVLLFSARLLGVDKEAAANNKETVEQKMSAVPAGLPASSTPAAVPDQPTGSQPTPVPMSLSLPLTSPAVPDAHPEGGSIVDGLVQLSHRFFGVKSDDAPAAAPAAVPTPAATAATSTAVGVSEEVPASSPSAIQSTVASATAGPTSSSDAGVQEMAPSSSSGEGEDASHNDRLPTAVPQPHTFGLQTYTFHEHKGLGLHLKMTKGGRLSRGGQELLIEQVGPGSAAEMMGVPVGGQITGINGEAAAAPELWEKLSSLKLTDRPVHLAVYVSPPEPEVASKPTKPKKRFGF
mmetsp:Transcript_40935/g.108209  ORF Transcript_40935/g.108209 Transcript_40935/m.108209 type:complete len:374 (+) Transcript_40935:31-1152(+)